MPSFRERVSGLLRRQPQQQQQQPGLTPNSVAAYQWIMANQAQAAVRASGAEASSWGGVTLPSEGGALGGASGDGSITYDRAQVLTPIWEMSQNAGRPAPPETLSRWRNALQTMYHENTHYLNARGRSLADGLPDFQIGSVRALEEGVTEAWSADQVNGYIQQLGAEHLAPGISGAVVRQPYPQYVAATQILADRLGQDTGLGRQEVMRQLAVQDPGRKWPVAAEMAYRSGGLDALVPPQHRDIVMGRIQGSMQQPFEQLAHATGTPAQQHLASVAAGHQAAAGYQAEVQAMRQHYISQMPQQQQVANQQQAVNQQQQQQQQGPQQQTTQPQPSIQERLNPAGNGIQERLNPTDGQTPQPSRITQALNPQESRITQALSGQNTQTPTQTAPQTPATATPTDPRIAYSVGAQTDGNTTSGPAEGNTTGGRTAAGGNPALSPDLQKAMAAANSGTAPASGAINDGAAKESGQGARPDHLDRGKQTPQRGHDGPDR